MRHGPEVEPSDQVECHAPDIASNPSHLPDPIVRASFGGYRKGYTCLCVDVSTVHVYIYIISRVEMLVCYMCILYTGKLYHIHTKYTNRIKQKAVFLQAYE